MATAYSKIQRNFWETDEAREMTPEEKYFWMYLQTNANVNTLGCYAFRMRKAMDETGYNRETLEKLLQRMEQVLRILYDEGTKEVFLLHWAEGNWNKKTATLRALAADLKEIQSKTLKETVKTLLLKNGIFTEEEVEKAEKTAPSAQERNEKEQRGTTGNKRSGEGEGEGEGELPTQNKAAGKTCGLAVRNNRYESLIEHILVGFVLVPIHVLGAARCGPCVERGIGGADVLTLGRVAELARNHQRPHHVVVLGLIALRHEELVGVRRQERTLADNPRAVGA